MLAHRPLLLAATIGCVLAACSDDSGLSRIDAGIVCPAEEACDGVDNDCDGLVDEVTTRRCGLDTGACVAGEQTCIGSVFSECVGAVGPTLERCNGVDDDCNGFTDEGCGPAAPFAPWNGQTTGSLWATGDGLAAKPLRPTLRWAPAFAALRYQLEVDDSCPADFRSCDFPSPEFSLELAGTSATPPSDLPVSTEPPVGRRYFWRVRSCNANECGAWSAVRYLDVGRVATDVNGDGYGDLVAGAPDTEQGAGAALVYLGGPGGIPAEAPAGTLTDATQRRFGASVAIAGDLNGDGFADVVVGSGDIAATGAASASVYFGGPGASFDPSPEAVLPGAGGQRGVAVNGLGDVNGDGFADLILQAPAAAGGGALSTVAFAFHGAAGDSFDAAADAALLGPASRGAVASSMAGPGDLDGDGYTDAVVGLPVGTGGSSAVLVYHGGPGGLGAELDAEISSRLIQSSFGVLVAPPGDLNGDGLADLTVGTSQIGAFYVYFGVAGAAAPAEVAGIQGIVSPGGGLPVTAGGDVNGDGYADLLLGTATAPGAAKTGWSYLYRGGPGDTFGALQVRWFYAERQDDGFGAAVATSDLDGDGCADLLIGAPRNDTAAEDAGAIYVYLGRAGSFPDTDPSATLRGSPGAQLGWDLH